MVREYLESVLLETKGQLDDCRIQCEKIRKKKQEIETKIAKIQMKTELSEEYFSPRYGNQTLRKQMNEYYGEIKEMDRKIQLMEEKEKELCQKKEEFQMMLDEVMELENMANVSRET